MNFSDALSDLLTGRNISVPQLAEMIGVKPSTPYFWTKGRSVPGKDRLDDIINALGLEPKMANQLIELRAKPEGRSDSKKTDLKKSHVSKSKFSKKFKKVINISDLSITEIAKKSKVTRASIHSWSNGDVVPKVSKLRLVLKALKCPAELFDELIFICESEWAKQPRPKGYKTRSIWEKAALKRVGQYSGFTKIQLNIPKDNSSDLIVSSKNDKGSTQIPIIFKNKTGDLNLLFVMACKARQMTNAEVVVIITFKNLTQYDEVLFNHFGIMVMTEEEFYSSENELASKIC